MIKSQAFKLALLLVVVSIPNVYANPGETQEVPAADPIQVDAAQVNAAAADATSMDSIVVNPSYKLGAKRGIPYKTDATELVPTIGTGTTGLGLSLDISTLKYSAPLDEFYRPKSVEEYVRDRLENPVELGRLDLSTNVVIDPWMCRPNYGAENFANLADISKVANECFKHKVTAIEREQLSEEEKLARDKKVCDCLYQSKFEPIKQMMEGERKKTLSAKKNDEIEADIKKNMMEMISRVTTLQDGMMFQSHVLYYDKGRTINRGTDPSSMYGTGFVNDLFKRGGAVRKEMVARGHEISERAIKSVGRGASFMGLKDNHKAENQQLKDQLTSVLSNVQVKSNAESLLAERDFKPGQCIGAKEFFSYKQFPEDENFYLSLGNENDFDEDNWNHRKLEKEFQELIADPQTNKQRIDQIKGRLKFLNRNPLIKNLFAAKNNFSEYASKKGLNSDMTAKLQAAAKNSDQRKKQLFGLINEFVKPKKTPCENNNCRLEALGNAKAFDNKMRQLFAQPDVALVVSAQAEITAFMEMKKFIDDPITPDVIPKEQNKLEDYVGKILGSPALSAYPHPKECVFSEESGFDGTTFNPMCANSYSYYCPVLEKSQKTQWFAEAKNYSAELDNESKDLFEPDFEKNRELRALNDKWCNSKRTPKKGGAAKSFNEFHASYCAQHKNDRKCRDRSYENIMALREIYEKDFGEHQTKGDLSSSDKDIIAFSTVLKERGPVANRSAEEARLLASEDTSLVSNDSKFDQLMNDLNLLSDSPGMFDNLDKKEKIEGAGMLANLEAAMATGDNNLGGQVFDNSYDADGVGYTNQIAAPQTTIGESPKIENMTEESKEELLSQWKREFEDWKKDSGSKEGNAQQISSAEAAMKAKIEALETLLTEQRKLTNDQYKLLNDAIANQRVQQPLVAETRASESNAEKENQEKIRARSSSGFTTTGGNPGISDEVLRAPASVKEFNSSGSGSGASSAAASSRKSSGSSGAVSSSASDSVAREEAKLVNLRRFSDGSITIESVGRGNQAVANAITLPVSDEQYRLLQSNPSALNLSQIEKNIPKDQMERLEKNGQIILVLQNGSNPPFEVKVEKKDNKLVYQVQDNNGNKVNPVQRIYTRQALELQLKVQQ